MKNKENFPTDDMLSLQQICGDGNIDLDIWYQHQFVHAEKIESRSNELKSSHIYQFGNKNIIDWATTGIVSLDGKEIQAFVARRGNCGFEFADIGRPRTKVLFSAMDLKSGELKLVWNEPVSGSHVVVDYEYDYEAERYNR